jgi:transcriptional regulator with XRE-family HTH domain
MNELQEYKLLNQITQKKLAEKLGLTESKVSRLMKVKTSLKDILTYAEYEEMMKLINFY